MSDLFLVGNGAGFSGDRVDAPIPVMRSLIKRGLPAAMFFECLGERTVALAQLERRRDPEAGYEPMLERLLEPILADAARAGIPILGNFGAANPLAAAGIGQIDQQELYDHQGQKACAHQPQTALKPLVGQDHQGQGQNRPEDG